MTIGVIYCGWDYVTTLTSIGGQAQLQLRETGQANADVTFGQPGGANANHARQAHLDLSSVFKTGEYADLATYVAAGLNEASPVGQTYTCTWDSATYRYTIATTGGTTFDLVFGRALGAAGDRGAQLLGMDDTEIGPTPNQTTYTGLRLPWFCKPASFGFSLFDPSEQTNSQWATAFTGDGGDFSIGAADVPERLDITIPMQTKPETFQRGLGDQDMSWQAFFAHCRGIEPVAIEWDGVTIVGRLREDGAIFRNDQTVFRRTANSDDYWDIQLKMYVDGVL